MLGIGEGLNFNNADTYVGRNLNGASKTNLVNSTLADKYTVFSIFVGHLFLKSPPIINGVL